MFTDVQLARSLPMAVAGCAAVGAAVGGFDYSGPLAGESASPEKKEERREAVFQTTTTASSRGERLIYIHGI